MRMEVEFGIAIFAALLDQQATGACSDPVR